MSRASCCCLRWALRIAWRRRSCSSRRLGSSVRPSCRAWCSSSRLSAASSRVRLITRRSRSSCRAFNSASACLRSVISRKMAMNSAPSARGSSLMAISIANVCPSWWRPTVSCAATLAMFLDVPPCASAAVPMSQLLGCASRTLMFSPMMRSWLRPNIISAARFIDSMLPRTSMVTMPSTTLSMLALVAGVYAAGVFLRVIAHAVLLAGERRRDDRDQQQGQQDVADRELDAALIGLLDLLLGRILVVRKAQRCGHLQREHRKGQGDVIGVVVAFAEIEIFAEVLDAFGRVAGGGDDVAVRKHHVGVNRPAGKDRLVEMDAHVIKR